MKTGERKMLGASGKKQAEVKSSGTMVVDRGGRPQTPRKKAPLRQRKKS